MRKQKTRVKGFAAATVVAALAALGLASVASAHEGLWAEFNACPSTNPEARKCINSLTTGGEVVLGEKTVPIVNPVTLQGGVTKPEERGEEFVEHLVAASNGETLSKTPQPVPGGLLGLVPPESSPPLIKELVEAVAESGLTGVNATLELARPASEIEISESNLAFEEGVALKLPVKIHLENTFLGGNCYVGSNTKPLIWNLTTGKTNPPVGIEPKHGFGGLLEFYEEEQIAEIAGSELVDNAWAAPKSAGCGGILLEALVDPVIDGQVGLPAGAGSNVAILKTTSFLARAAAVNEH
ncbi:MAG: hypothetical protein JWO14_3917 [Solirubrobacterales bacterium]|nr:hypothetical protein [Solirubrobacterales bacterium]